MIRDEASREEGGEQGGCPTEGSGPTPATAPGTAGVHLTVVTIRVREQRY